MFCYRQRETPASQPHPARGARRARSARSALCTAAKVGFREAKVGFRERNTLLGGIVE